MLQQPRFRGFVNGLLVGASLAPMVLVEGWVGAGIWLGAVVLGSVVGWVMAS